MAVNALSPLGPTINNAFMHPVLTQVGNMGVAYGLKKHVVPGPRPIIFGMTKKQILEIYKTIMFFCKVVACGSAVGMVSAALAKPVLGESAQEFQQRVYEYMLGKPDQMMELLSFYHTLRNCRKGRERNSLNQIDWQPYWREDNHNLHHHRRHLDYKL